MRKLALILAFVVLAGLGPPERMLLTGYSPAREEAFISSQSPTADLNIPASEVEVGPIVHLLMEDNAASTAVVNKANVAINGTASANTDTLSTTTNCAVSRCLDFNGTTTLVDLGSNPIGTGADSACLWHRADGNHETAGWLIGNGNFLFVNSANGQTLSLYCEGATAATTGAVLTQGTLYHFCATRTAAGVANLYVNGVLTGAANQSCGTPSDAGSSNVIIGNSAAATRTVNGKLDDVRIYNYALSPAQISAIYNNGAGHQNLASKAKANVLTVDATPAVMSVQDKQGVEFYQSTAASRPTLTTMNGRQALRFDGVDDYMASLTTTGDVFAAGAKTLFAGARSAVTGDVANRYLLADSASNYTILYRVASGANFRFLNNDGSSDSVQQAIIANNAFMAGATHADGNISISINRAAATTAASGNTSRLTDTLILSGGDRWLGEIQRLTTFNKVLSPYARDRISKHLCKQAGASCN